MLVYKCLNLKTQTRELKNGKIEEDTVEKDES